MQINQIEPKFKELEEGIEGAMSQIGALEKRLEQLAQAHNTRLESLEETEHTHPEPSRIQSEALIEAAGNVAEEAAENVLEEVTSGVFGEGSEKPTSDAELESEPEPVEEESEDTDARFRPEPEVDDLPMVKVDIQTNLIGPEKLMLEKVVAEKIAELESKSGIKTEIKITDG